MMKNTKICDEGSLNILENATINKFTALSINSTHIKMMMALRLINTPMMPMQKRERLKNI
jgi:hypothetical protein